MVGVLDTQIAFCVNAITYMTILVACATGVILLQVPAEIHADIITRLTTEDKKALRATSKALLMICDQVNTNLVFAANAPLDLVRSLVGRTPSLCTFIMESNAALKAPEGRCFWEKLVRSACGIVSRAHSWLLLG